MKVLRLLGQLSDYCRETRGQLRFRRQSLHATALTNAEQRAASCAQHNRLGVFALYVVAAAAGHSRAHAAAAGFMRPSPLIYGKLCALLCAAALALTAVHTVWQHTLIASNGAQCYRQRFVGLVTTSNFIIFEVVSELIFVLKSTNATFLKLQNT